MDTSAGGAVLKYKVIDDSGAVEQISAQLSGGHAFDGPVTMDGVGRYEWADGTSYAGDFQRTEMTGFGVYTFKNGVYDGHVFRGIRHGQGTLTLRAEVGAKSATKYVGEWHLGKRHGTGTSHYANGGFYDGDWVDDKRCGHGGCRYPNGDAFEGEWRDDVKHGIGAMRWASAEEIYFGEWRDDEPHGIGLHLSCGGRGVRSKSLEQISPQQMSGAHNFTTLNGMNWYYGEWAAGKRDGRGTFHYSNGAQYDGEWRQNKKHGHGVYIYENGARFEGEFEDDREVYTSDEQKAAVRESMGRLFVIHTEDLKKDVNVARLEKMVLRHWQFLRTMASDVHCLGKVWMLIDAMQCKETMSTYEMSKTVMSSAYTVHPGKTVDVTDGEHRFRFREFLRILLRLSAFSSQTADEFIATLQSKAAVVGNLSLKQFFWKRMTEPFKSVWSDVEVQRIFEERFEVIADALSEVEPIEERVTATYIDGAALKRILYELITEPILRRIVRQQFELCYFSRPPQPMILEEQREPQSEKMDEADQSEAEHDQDAQVEETAADEDQQDAPEQEEPQNASVEPKPEKCFEFEAIRFLKHECKMFFVLLISIKVAHDAMLLEMERIQGEKEEAESEELAQQKGKKSKKDKKVEPTPEIELSEEVEEEVKELSLITVTAEHIQSVFAQIKEQKDNSDEDTTIKDSDDHKEQPAPS